MEDMWVEIEDIIREIVETTRGAAAHVMEILEVTLGRARWHGVRELGKQAD